MEVAIYQLEGQPMAIVSFAQGVDALQAAKQAVPVGVPFWMVDASIIPADRTFRDAWELDTAAVGEPSGIGETYKPEGAA